jgi:hypothetical protein
VKIHTYHIEKRALAAFLAAIYMLICVAVVFVLPKADNALLHGKTKFFAKVTNESTKGIKNNLKRTDKLRSENSNTLLPVHSFVFTLTDGFCFKSQVLSQRLRGPDYTQLSTPSQFGCLLNCCRRI